VSLDDDLPDWTPRTCTLPTAEQPFRVAEFDDLFRECVIAVNRADATCLRLTLHGGDEVAARVLDLMARETECCSFFTFELSSTPGAVRLLVQVPPGQVSVLDAFTTRAQRLAAA